jgi:hypothetical protein
VEQAHQILKLQLQRQKGGGSAPATQINKGLFTLNFLNCSESGFTPAEKHWEHHNKQHLPQVLLKDVLTSAWEGPSLVLLWGQSHACVFPEGAENPILVPSQFMKTHGTHQPSDAEALPDRGGEEPSLMRTNPLEILPLKVKRNHPYWSHKRKYHHIDNMVKQPRHLPHNSGSSKVLGAYGQECYIKQWGQEETHAVLLVMITIISQQVNAAEA